MVSTELSPKSFLIIDEDDVIHNMVAFQLKSMGVRHVDLFTDASSGWVAILNKTYDFIFFDWKLDKLPGVTIFNRLRSLGNYKHTPIMIASNVVYKKDFRLFEEYPGTALIEKPFSNRQFERCVRDLFSEVLWYEQHSQTIKSLVEQCKNDAKSAVRILQKLVDKAPNPQPLAILGGKELINQGFLEAAEEWFLRIVQADEENHVAWSELGQIFTQRETLEEARKCLTHAHKISPKSLERVHALAEVELQLKNPAVAKEYFQEALEIDHTSEKAKAGVTVATNLENHFNLHVNHEGSDEKNSFASLLNIVGITMVNSGKIEEGLGQYNAALNFIKLDDDKARLLFNMGLAYMKDHRHKEAITFFQKSLDFKVFGFTKPKMYIDKLKKAL